jgi:hypothetical protein
VTAYLPTVSKFGILQAEAGNRAETDRELYLTLRLIAGFYDEINELPSKAT